ncbi:MarR family transcriptional regulator [Nocardia puris]|uniref:MarR family transcriptional regulator n=1 Tax=Nocardia puris TaxID=208602 RepID=A0A366CUW6_9NOCA|nr:MarR family transcriptional regulator [Nocardia puris]MBF6216029.1 MarR family transcriptional regulator [Nocardia puris]MBF6370221.1 MarR family transcriptional regulator [Nocardia puris]MBF6463552.1 MarR family transcriptional regulator [Nocardia puris]RBO80115.1 MarR family transcriptional regulator [Nocardia puris]
MSTAEPTLLKLLVEATRAYESALNRDLRAALDPDLRPAHYAVFRHLSPEGSRVTALADAAGMTQQAMGELITHLERRGYVERRVDPSDKRARLVMTTESGRAAVAFAADRLAELDGKLSAALGVDAVAGLRAALGRVPDVIGD